MVLESTNGHQQHLGGRSIVKYRQHYYDISEFYKKHPGGLNTLKGLNNADMTSRFMKAPPHSDAAMYLMNEYKIKPEMIKNGSARNGSKIAENGIELIEDKSAADSNNNKQFDESLEHLVDWSKAMLPQISKIATHYDEWVHKPVDRPLVLFGQWYLEMLTKTPWWIIPIYWIPVITKCVIDEFMSVWQAGDTAKLIFLISYFLLGILLWTLVEYSLHRWLFHMKINGNASGWLCTLHFLLHGLHHKVPFDAQRLVFPPIGGTIIASLLYTPLSFVAPMPRVLAGGTLLGYLCYDLMHYYLHYGNPTNKHMYHMKRYHYQHHFVHQNDGYGISSPLWDLIFNTRIRLRKLKYQLRWK